MVCVTNNVAPFVTLATTLWTIETVQFRSRFKKFRSEFSFFVRFCFFEFLSFKKSAEMCKWGNQTREQGRTRARKGRKKFTSHQRFGTVRTSHDISTGHSITFSIDSGSMYKYPWPRSHETGRRTGIVLRGWSLVLTVTAAVATFSTIAGHCILFCIFWALNMLLLLRGIE